MNSKHCHRLLFVAAFSAPLSLWPANTNACWLSRLFRRQQPVTVNYPAYTANYGACCGQAQCEQTVLRYAPQIAYRTVWQPVPVTTYRRTVSYNPSTGLPITCTQPCTSYTYQARRVPYTTYRPYYATEPVTMPATGSCGVNYTPVSGCSSCSTGQSYASTPGYTVTNPSYSSVTSGTNSIAGATEWEPVSPTTSGSGGASLDPADVPPSIDSDAPSVRKIPSTTPPAADSNGSTGDASLLNNELNSPTNANSSVYDPRPLPNLDRQPSPGSYPGEVNQRYRTAIRPIPTTWVSNRIVWSNGSMVRPAQALVDEPVSQVRRSRGTQPPQRPSSNRWDDSGWKSSR